MRSQLLSRRVEDLGDRETALKDAAEALKLKAPQVRHLRKVIAAMEEPEDEDSIEGEPEKPETTPDEVKALVNRPGVLNR